MTTLNIRDITGPMHGSIIDRAGQSGVTIKTFSQNAFASYLAGWRYEGPDGVDCVEWWTHPAYRVGVTRSVENRAYRLAYVSTGEPTNGNQYVEFSTLAEAIQEVTTE